MLYIFAIYHLCYISIAIYLSDIEWTLEKGQIGWIVVGKLRFWNLSYVDDLVAVATSKEEIQALYKKLEKYLDKKDMILNTEESKLVRFSKTRVRMASERRHYRKSKIKEIPGIYMLVYIFHKNGKHDLHIKEICRRVNTVSTCSDLENRTKEIKYNFKFRMLLFDKIVITLKGRVGKRIKS